MRRSILISTTPCSSRPRAECQDEVYLYCLDDAVNGLADERLQTLRGHGLRLFACAFAAQRRKLPQTENALYGGLTMLNDVMAATDRFVSFN